MLWEKRVKKKKKKRIALYLWGCMSSLWNSLLGRLRSSRAPSFLYPLLWWEVRDGEWNDDSKALSGVDGGGGGWMVGVLRRVEAQILVFERGLTLIPGGVFFSSSLTPGSVLIIAACQGRWAHLLIATQPCWFSSRPRHQYERILHQGPGVILRGGCQPRLLWRLQYYSLTEQVDWCVLPRRDQNIIREPNRGVEVEGVGWGGCWTVLTSHFRRVTVSCLCCCHIMSLGSCSSQVLNQWKSSSGGCQL